MTRTERNISPAALIKDRSVSKSGLDKSLKKQGAGPHNWGSITQETANYIHNPNSLEQLSADERIGVDADADADADEADAEKKEGKDKVEENGNGNGIDIKRNGPVPRRMSSMSEEEKKEAAAWRKGAMGRGDVDLKNIARTSGAFSQSPPEANGLSTSPVRNMNTLAQKLGKY